MKAEKKHAPASDRDTALSADDNNHRTIRWLTLCLFFAVLLLNLLLLTKNYYWDGVFFAQVIEDAPRPDASLIHPNHLFYVVLEYAIYRGVRLLGFGARALVVLQLSNCFFSAAAATVFFRICLSCFKSLYAALTLAVMFAFSALWWKFSTDADAYVPAALLLLSCFYLVLPDRPSRPFVLAVVHALAMTIHQLSVFFFPVAIVGLWLQSKRPDKFKNALKYSVIVGVLTVAIYFFVFYRVSGNTSITRFVSWTTSFSPEHGFTFNLWNNLLDTLRSPARMFFGGRFKFVEEFWGLPMFALTTIAMLALLAFVFVMFRNIRELKAGLVAAWAGPRKFRALTVLCAIWIATYILFLFFFIPQNTFYRLFYLPPLVLLGGTFIAAAQSATGHVRGFRAALFVAAMVLSNLTLSQYPYSQVRANPPLELALKLDQTWSPGTIVYFASPNSDQSLVKYFTPATVWVQTQPDALMQRSAGLPSSVRSAWLETTMIDALQMTEEGRSWLTIHANRRPDCELINRKFRIEFRQLKPDSFVNPQKVIAP